MRCSRCRRPGPGPARADPEAAGVPRGLDPAPDSQRAQLLAGSPGPLYPPSIWNPAVATPKRKSAGRLRRARRDAPGSASLPAASPSASMAPGQGENPGPDVGSGRARTALLYVTQVAPYVDGPAGIHGVLEQSAGLAELAESAGLDFAPGTDVRSLDPDAAGAVVALFTIGETPWSPVQRAALVAGVRTGPTSVLAMHSATDSCHGWDEYGLLVGGRFAGHPWTCTITVDVLEPASRVRPFRPTLSWHDEVLPLRRLRPDRADLARGRPDESARRAPTAIPMSRERIAETGLPLSWCFTEGKGRVFSTSLGHFAVPGRPLAPCGTCRGAGLDHGPAGDHG